MPWWMWLMLVIVLPFGVAVLRGAPFLPVLRQDVETLIDLAGLSPGDTLLDLGSGDGRLLRAAASRGIYGVGYEINPFLWTYSVLRSWPQRRMISFYLGDYWRSTWPPAQGVVIFGLERLMPRFDECIQQWAGDRVKVVSYVFEIPGRKAVQTTKNAWVYDYPIR